MERGVVLSPKFVDLPTGSVLFKSAVDDFELRKYLTYWDKIDVPKNSKIEFDCWQFQHLEQAGYLQRTIYGVPQQFKAYRLKRNHQMYIGNCSSAEIIDCTDVTINKEAGHQILEAHDDVFALRNVQEPGQWSKAQISTTIMAPSFVEKEAIEMELYNLLPVPDASNSLDDIIKFKEAHHAELIAFRIYLDELYQSILTAGDIPRAKNTAMNKLEQSLIDINRTMKESRITYVLDSLRSVMSDITGIGGLGLGGVGAAPVFGMNPFIAGVACAGIGIASKFIPQSANSTPKELTYLKSVRKSFKPQ